MSLKTETAKLYNPFAKIIKYLIFITIALIGLFFFGYTKPVVFDEVRKEITL